MCEVIVMNVKAINETKKILWSFNSGLYTDWICALKSVNHRQQIMNLDNREDSRNVDIHGHQLLVHQFKNARKQSSVILQIL